MVKLEEFHRGETTSSPDQPIRVDAKGSQCPGPIMTLANAVHKAAIGQVIIVEATDSGFKSDAVSWAAITGNTLESLTESDGVITAHFTKRFELGQADVPQKEDMLTLVMFSEEMDKGLAAFNIALGALAMGMKVEIFFTFWGLSLLRKKPDHATHTGIKDEILSKLLPSDDESLPLSRQNMMGLGAKMMKKLMSDKNVPSLDFMIHLAKFNGAKFIACNMSMQILNIKPEDLMEGVEIGGVARMLEHARKSNLNYFI